jgi:hypothetical protein
VARSTRDVGATQFDPAEEGQTAEPQNLNAIFFLAIPPPTFIWQMGVYPFPRRRPNYLKICVYVGALGSHLRCLVAPIVKGGTTPLCIFFYMRILEARRDLLCQAVCFIYALLKLARSTAAGAVGACACWQSARWLTADGRTLSEARHPRQPTADERARPEA